MRRINRFIHTYHQGNYDAQVFGKYPNVFVEPEKGHLINMINVIKVTQEGPYLSFETGKGYSCRYQMESGEEAKKVYEKIINKME